MSLRMKKMKDTNEIRIEENVVLEINCFSLTLLTIYSTIKFVQLSLSQAMGILR